MHLQVTRRKLTLGTRDSTTGWYAKTFSETTVEMIVVAKGSSTSLLPPGTYVRTDALGLTTDGFMEGDETQVDNKYYEVKAIREHSIGDSFYYRECDLTLLALHGLTGANYASSTVEEARYRTKLYLETYLDDEALPNYIIAYGEPDYPLLRVFKDKSVDLVYSIGKGTSTPQRGHDKYVYGYVEKVLVRVQTIDKTGLVGENTMWDGEHELRRVSENYPLGSIRSFETINPKTQSLGSTTLYGVECVLEYTRGKTSPSETSYAAPAVTTPVGSTVTDADTLDGIHASGFFQGTWTTGSCTGVNPITTPHGLGVTPSLVLYAINAVQPYASAYNADATNLIFYHSAAGALTVKWAARV